MPSSRKYTFSSRTTEKDYYNLRSLLKNDSDEDNDEDDEIESSAELLEVNNSDIYLYSGIDKKSAIFMNTNIKKLELKHLAISNKYNIDPPPITIRINSEGGCVFSALSIVDTIRNCRVPVISIVEGEAASAATLISCVANVRKITKHSHMLIHEMISHFWGKFDQFKDEWKNQNTLMKTLKTIYNDNTNMTKKTLDECLKKDIYWSANICKKNGLVDEII